MASSNDVSLVDAVEMKKFDLRTIERNLAKGLITREQYQQFLDSLEDDESRLATVDLAKADPAYPDVMGPVVRDGQVVRKSDSLDDATDELDAGGGFLQ